MTNYNADQMREYMAARRARIKGEMVALLGGHCRRCDQTEDLDFDHIDPSTKIFHISGRGLDRPRAVLLAEVAKCQLLCRPHHIEKTANDNGGYQPHGLRAYNHDGCRCPICSAAKQEYNARRRSRA